MVSRREPPAKPAASARFSLRSRMAEASSKLAEEGRHRPARHDIARIWAPPPAPSLTWKLAVVACMLREPSILPSFTSIDWYHCLAVRCMLPDDPAPNDNSIHQKDGRTCVASRTCAGVANNRTDVESMTCLPGPSRLELCHNPAVHE